jgi:hypothetical protein
MIYALIVIIPINVQSYKNTFVQTMKYVEKHELINIICILRGFELTLFDGKICKAEAPTFSEIINSWNLSKFPFNGNNSETTQNGCIAWHSQGTQGARLLCGRGHKVCR